MALISVGQQIEIPRRSQHCVAGKEILEAGQAYYSALEDTEEGVVRYDFCKECWESERGKSCRDQGLGYWKGLVPKRETKSENLPAERDARAMALLKANLLSSEDREGIDEENFVLALYLARRRLITLRNSITREGVSYSLYEELCSEEMLTIKSVELALLRVADIQKMLAKKFAPAAS